MQTRWQARNRNRNRELELCYGTLGDRQPRTRQLPQSRPGNKQQKVDYASRGGRRDGASIWKPNDSFLSDRF